jgi:hypothetical protein
MKWKLNGWTEYAIRQSTSESDRPFILALA